MNRYTQSLDKYKKRIFIVGNIIMILLVIYGYRYGIFTDQSKMQAFLNDCGIAAPAVFIILQVVQVIIPILPGAVGCLYGVIFWGAIKGFILNYIGICIGSICAFFIARQFGQEFVLNMTGSSFFDKYSKYLLKENQFEKLLALLIFLPVAPDDFLCYLAGISKISIKKFILIILIGKPASIMLYSLGLSKIFQTILSIIK